MESYCHRSHVETVGRVTGSLLSCLTVCRGTHKSVLFNVLPLGVDGSPSLWTDAPPRDGGREMRGVQGKQQEGTASPTL